MSIKKLVTNTLFAAVIMLGLSTFSNADTILFSDNFNSDNPSSELNFNSLINWTVSDGTIDYIRNGGYGISCYGDTGGCIDMDGSTGDAGRITTKDTFNVLAGQWYYLEGQVSGNQRGGAPDTITFGIWDETNDSFLLSGSWNSIPFNAPFDIFQLGFSLPSDHTIRIYVEGGGGDDMGAILDNVTFSTEAETVVPEPTSLLLLGTGLGVIGLASWRRRK